MLNKGDMLIAKAKVPNMCDEGQRFWVENIKFRPDGSFLVKAFNGLNRFDVQDYEVKKYFDIKTGMTSESWEEGLAKFWQNTYSKCTCGAESVGSDRHSHYSCDKVS